MNKYIESLKEEYPDLVVLKPRYFDECIIGHDSNGHLIYSTKDIIFTLVDNEDMNYVTALEYFENYIEGGIMTNSPIFLRTLEDY
jgi:hypothetical protein